MNQYSYSDNQHYTGLVNITHIKQWHTSHYLLPCRHIFSQLLFTAWWFVRQ